MPAVELQRENNLARNRWLTKQLGLKKKRDPNDEGKRRKKKQKGEGDDWDSEESESDSDSDAADDGVRTTPIKTRGKRKASPTTQGEATGTPPAWAVNAKKMLEDVKGVGMGDDWQMVLKLWWRLEKESGFSTKKKTHPTIGRPKAVGTWVKNARKGTPEIDVDAMEREWWGWWTVINPKWHVREGALVQEGNGEWDVLRCPGQNGFLNVIVCLKWWQLGMGNASDTWQRGVADVKWVLGQMLGNVDEDAAPPAPSAPAAAVEAPTEIAPRVAAVSPAAPALTPPVPAMSNPLEPPLPNPAVPRACWAERR
ncbi:hypothetical protein B0H19DRAFT_1261276 [Mycena capillaripes]|nr:hypothetical protein B0H19DRAFT_1261276 [Mycena capillaripes]